jgi:hypothetical protein
MRFKQVRKKTIIIGVLAALVLAFLFGQIINFLFFPQIEQKYKINIDRNVDGYIQEKVLAVAESINYTGAAKLDRFNGPTNPEDYIHPKTYLAYTFANYIDSEVLSYYQNRYDSLQGKGSPGGIEYTYKANVSEYQSYRIYNSPAPEGVAWHNTTMVLVGSTSNGSLVSICSAMQIYTKT